MFIFLIIVRVSKVLIDIKLVFWNSLELLHKLSTSHAYILIGNFILINNTDFKCNGGSCLEHITSQHPYCDLSFSFFGVLRSAQTINTIIFFDIILLFLFTELRKMIGYF